MWLLLLYFIISLIVPTLMGVGSLVLASKMSLSESFECGFDSFNVSVFPVSLRFFIFCIIFLILDLELIIMSFSPMVLWWNSFMINILLFLILVTISMLLEWVFGSMSWIE